MTNCVIHETAGPRSDRIMVILLLKILPSPSKRRELLDILRSVVGPTSIQPGCRACEIYEGSGDDQTVLYLEQWDALTQIQRHIQSALYVNILTAIEFSTTQPEIKFYEISQVWGMELLKTLRTEEGVINK